MTALTRNITSLTGVSGRLLKSLALFLLLSSALALSGINACAESLQPRHGNAHEQELKVMLQAVMAAASPDDIACAHTLYLDSERQHSELGMGLIAVPTGININIVQADFWRQQHWCRWQQQNFQRLSSVELLHRKIPSMPVRFNENNPQVHESITASAIELLSAEQVLTQAQFAPHREELIRHWQQGPHAPLYMTLAAHENAIAAIVSVNRNNANLLLALQKKHTDR